MTTRERSYAADQRFRQEAPRRNPSTTRVKVVSTTRRETSRSRMIATSPKKTSMGSGKVERRMN